MQGPRVTVKQAGSEWQAMLSGAPAGLQLRQGGRPHEGADIALQGGLGTGALG